MKKNKQIIEEILFISNNFVSPKWKGSFKETAFLFIENEKGELERKFNEVEAREKGLWNFKEPMISDSEIFKKLKEYDKRNSEYLASEAKKEKVFNEVKEILSTEDALEILKKLINKGI